MLVSNNIRFGTDDFYLIRQALLKSKIPFDTTNQTSVEGFTITGSEPANSSRRIIFKLDGGLFYFKNSSLTNYPYVGDSADIILYGNTVEELLQLSSIPEFVGKKIYPIIALQAPYDSPAFPTIKIGLKVRSNTAIYEKTFETPEYQLAADGDSIPRIADIVEDVSTTGNGTVTIKVRFLTVATDDSDSSGESWTDYLPLSDANNVEAKSVQFKFDYKVTTTDGSDSAKVNSITIRHNMGAAIVSGDFADIYSVVQNYQTDLQTCRVVVKHKQLTDSKISAFINFMTPPSHRERIHIGIADGTVQQLPLGLNGVKDYGIDQNSLKVYVDGQPLTDFDYNVEVSEVTVNTNAGSVVTASYDYGHGKENWLEMTQLGDSQPYLKDDTYMTLFGYTLPDSETEGKCQSNIRLRLSRPTGRVSNEVLGIATGYMQQFVLPHAAKEETIELDCDWSYEPSSRILTLVAPKNVELVISYDYIGENITVDSFSAAWVAAV